MYLTGRGVGEDTRVTSLRWKINTILGRKTKKNNNNIPILLNSICLFRNNLFQ